MKQRVPASALSAFAALLLAASSAAQTTGQTEVKPPTPANQSDARTVATPPKTVPGWARLSFFANGSTTTPTGGDSNGFSELITSIAAQAPRPETGGIDYGLDLRFAGYPTTGSRTNRLSIYNAYVGVRTAQDRVAFKVGQLWLNDLGGIGALGGGVFETTRRRAGSGMQLRVAAFGGLEPQLFQAGYVTGIRKFGGYVAYEAVGKPRRHVVGYVNIRDSGLTERSVLSTTNFIPVNSNKAFIYQAAEFDLAGPAGLGKGGLAYFFTNARVKASSRVEVQGTYHRGTSIDTRGITLDQLNGRPIDQKALDGFRYESARGRVMVQVARGVRIFAGYGIDRNNRDDASSRRLQAGVWATNLANSGLDVNLSDSRTTQGGALGYDSWYASVGRTVVPRVYVTGEFTSSLSVVRFLGGQNFTILSRPRTRRYAASTIVNVYRPASVLFTFERVTDASFSEQRVLTGLTYRF